MKSKKKITPNSKAMELNAVLNEVGGAVKLKWQKAFTFKGVYAETEDGEYTIRKDYDCYTLRHNPNSSVEDLKFKKMKVAKIVAELIENG